nr:hypothetical protein [uncultured Holophaga sp.]
MDASRLRPLLFALLTLCGLGTPPSLRAADDQTCLACHGDRELSKQGPEGKTKSLFVDASHFTGSVHGSSGCQSCHIDVDPEAGHPGNPVAPVDCGMCHDKEAAAYADSIHAQARSQGRPAPDCVVCHGNHGIIKPRSDTFRRSLLGRCGGCHTEQSETYSDTYHGKVTRLGYTATAECYDCHGAHRIKPPADPQSQVNRAQLVATCGKCHPGANAGFVQYIAHGNHRDYKKYPVLFITFWAMTLLLVCVFVFFGIHSLLWLPRALRLRREIRQEEAAKVGGERTEGKEEDRHE